jgi:hypothetical protein
MINCQSNLKNPLPSPQDYEQGAERKNLTTDSRSPTKPIPKRSNRAGIEFPRFVNALQK